nr:MAG TPA: hypothetical protein [Caudoviricetes sp.]DAU00961.1 MAG TPA: hypothetical protein [Caudoviricetes sp.]
MRARCCFLLVLLFKGSFVSFFYSFFQRIWYHSK